MCLYVKQYRLLCARVFICGFFFLYITALPVFAEATDPWNVESRTYVKEFAGQLKAELVKAMQASGPVNAIDVCHIQAPSIATRLSEQYQIDISRTSLKIRNPDNKADVWEREVLLQFEQRKQAGEQIDELEYSEIQQAKGETVLRYMKAIPTQSICLVCHGANINDAVQNQINKLYPDDQATGFNEGDIRGAFTIIKAMN